MNRTILIALILNCVFGFTLLYGQRSKATDKGTTLVSGSFSFSNQGGNLYKSENDDRRTSITIVPGAVHFVFPGVGLGGDLSYTRESQGEASFTTWGLGPKFGYFFELDGKGIPFVTGGINLLSINIGGDNEYGIRLKFGGGFLVRHGHLAISIEAGYIFDRFKIEGANQATTGNTIFIGAGFGGFLYK